jgi:hypothetical protein
MFALEEPIFCRRHAILSTYHFLSICYRTEINWVFVVEFSQILTLHLTGSNNQNEESPISHFLTLHLTGSYNHHEKF